MRLIMETDVQDERGRGMDVEGLMTIRIIDHAKEMITPQHLPARQAVEVASRLEGEGTMAEEEEGITEEEEVEVGLVEGEAGMGKVDEEDIIRAKVKVRGTMKDH
jgi:hypothetical protein